MRRTERLRFSTPPISTHPRRARLQSSSPRWGERPTLLVVAEDEELVVKSFRNLEKVLVTVPAELEVASLVWARSVLITEAAMPLVLGRAGVAAEEEEAGE